MDKTKLGQTLVKTKLRKNREVSRKISSKEINQYNRTSYVGQTTLPKKHLSKKHPLSRNVFITFLALVFLSYILAFSLLTRNPISQHFKEYLLDLIGLSFFEDIKWKA